MQAEFQHYYSSIQCNVILQKSLNLLMCCLGNCIPVYYNVEKQYIFYKISNIFGITAVSLIFSIL